MIKEVHEIPTPNTKPKGDKPLGYYHELIREDILSAYNVKIKTFEFINYDAKPEYIAQVAKSEAYNICKELIYAPAKDYVKKKLAKEFDDPTTIRCTIPTRHSPSSIIKISGVTLEDGIKHIYCQIDYKVAKAFKKDLLEISRERTIAQLKVRSKRAFNVV